MKAMKRLIFCMALLFSTLPSFSAEPGEDPGVPRGSPPGEAAEEANRHEQAPSRLDRILSRMDQAYRAIESYRAEFEQESETKTFRNKRTASGRVYFLKPGRMRWSYLEPEKREMYLSGERMSIYLPDRNQVIEQTLSAALPGLAPARLFMGIDELAATFTVSLDCPGDNDESAHCLCLTPKNRQSITVEEVLLWVGKKDFLPLRTESRDVLGNRTRILFRNGEVNVPLEEELFRFDAPPEAEVLRY